MEIVLNVCKVGSQAPTSNAATRDALGGAAARRQTRLRECKLQSIQGTRVVLKQQVAASDISSNSLLPSPAILVVLRACNCQVKKWPVTADRGPRCMNLRFVKHIFGSEAVKMSVENANS